LKSAVSTAGRALTTALGFAFGLGLVSGFASVQDVPAEARRHYEAGVAAVEAARSSADYPAALREFEAAVRLAPGWPGAVRGLGLVQRAAGRFGDAALSFGRYLELAPQAPDAARVKVLVGEMERERDLDAEAARIFGGLAAGRYARKTIERTVVEGEPLGWPGGLESFRPAAGGGLEVENPWYPGDRYHPKSHPLLPRAWEPVAVSGRTYEYAYSHYMDTTGGYVVRFDYRVAGEIVPATPPRIRETVAWETAWGAPVGGNRRPWTGDLAEWGTVEYVYELSPKAGEGSGAIDARDAQGRTRLHAAAVAGRRDEAGALIAEGADINAHDNAGATPLHLAAGFGHGSVVDLLLTMGADIGARNTAGDTPLHAAAFWGQLGVVSQLVAFGADPGALNKEGLTPLAVAEKQNRAEVVAYFKGREAVDYALIQQLRSPLAFRGKEGEGKPN